MAMATGTINQHLRGAIGDLLFRNYNGKTVVSKRPVYKNETNTAARKQARGNFREATKFANASMRSVKLKSYYTQKARQLKLPNAYTAALTDYMRKAKVMAFTKGGSSFAPRKGGVINIVVEKSAFKIDKASIVLCDVHGAILSERNLSKPDGQKNVFRFMLAEDLPDLAWVRITTNEPANPSYIIRVSEFKVG